ncbi:hypothetical protein MKZ38_001060 [Zalerion maritima]|uniref:Transcription factor TFIIIC triple barrel domain-containing protein n=1 Tax=Zalerion maritima TaxID=339359 RepID=A0AAD5RS73_9PEZI|nr:hypothetical protein MKZ38_001060 [Zalerion maritima]
MDSRAAPDPSGQPPKDPFAAATLAVDPDNRGPKSSDEADDDESEWEYEYSTTETETYYVTVDMSVPDLEIQQPNTFSQTTKTNRKRWRNPLNEPLSHLHDQTMKNLAIDSDDEDGDDSEESTFVPPPPEQDEMPQLRQPGGAKQKQGVSSQAQGNNKISAKRAGKMPENMWNQHKTDRLVAPGEPKDIAATKTGQTEQAGDHTSGKRPKSGGRDAQKKIQVLAFHDANPVFLHKGRTYVGQWGTVIGSDMVFAKNAEGDRFPILRNLKNSDVDLVSISAARITATEVEFTPKDSFIDSQFQKLRKKQDGISRRRGRHLNSEPGVNNEEQQHLEIRRMADEEHRMKWLMNLQAIKREKGETDNVPLVLLPPERKDARVSGSAGGAGQASNGGRTPLPDKNQRRIVYMTASDGEVDLLGHPEPLRSNPAPGGHESDSAERGESDGEHGHDEMDVDEDDTQSPSSEGSHSPEDYSNLP